MTQLVFVHGRSQQDKDALALKGEWTSALRSGLSAAGLELSLPDEEIRFPYYGNTLRDLVGGMAPDDAAEVIIRGEGLGQQQESFIRSFVAEVREQRGITDRQLAARAGPEVVERGMADWPWVTAVLRLLDDVDAVSAATVALVTNDVFKYLTNPGIGELIDTEVGKAITPGEPTVVVGHSLGSVVAYRLLRKGAEANGWQVPLFVTVGSPLGVNAVKDNLGTIGHPSRVGPWFNARDKRDIVALNPLDAVHFGITPPIENHSEVLNSTDNRHGISGYLSDPLVAARIHQALLA